MLIYTIPKIYNLAMFRIILFLAIFFSQLLAESDLDPVEAPILDLSSFYESSVGEYILIDAQPINVDTSTTYQWFFNSFAVPPTFGGNNSSYQIYGDTYSNGVWRVAVTNSAGTSSHEFVYQVFSDDDADGLSDYREDNITLTDSNDPDTDDDGLLDGVETNTKIYVNATDLGTDPLDADSDSDGLLDGVETNTGVYAGIDDTGTSPLLSDSDGDGIEDGKETATGLWVNFSDTGTNPNIADTDGDGMLDGIEFNDSQTSEFVNEDIDGDGNLDLDEDVDGDGKLDVAEDVDGDGILDAGEDLDGDGKLDTYESVWFYSEWYDSINEEYQHSGDKTQLEADFMEWENLNGYYGWYEHNDTDGDGNLDLPEDVDGDGNLDVAEDVDGDGNLDVAEDLDGDGKLDTYESVWFYGEQMYWYEEEYQHSGDKTQLETDFNGWVMNRTGYGWYYHNDTDGDGNLDLNEDLDGDGNLDVTEDLDGDGNLDVAEDLDADGNLDVFEDANGNGVLDVVVVRSGTNPNLNDSDNDGFGDSEEVTIYGTNPNEFDTDKDGLSDSEEVTIYETDPNTSDSSGDGLNDGDVVSAGFDPNTNFTDLLVFASGNEGYEAMVMERDIAIAQRDAAIVESNSKLWPAEVRDLRPGSMMIEVHQGRANLSLEIQESSDLQTWVGGDEAVIEIPLDAEETVKFFRFAMPQE